MEEEQPYHFVVVHGIHWLVLQTLGVVVGIPLVLCILDSMFLTFHLTLS